MLKQLSNDILKTENDVPIQVGHTLKVLIEYNSFINNVLQQLNIFRQNYIQYKSFNILLQLL